eukprot:scaffold7302_cov72-Cyclotella_meneghiniana.AAC.2
MSQSPIDRDTVRHNLHAIYAVCNDLAKQLNGNKGAYVEIENVLCRDIRMRAIRLLSSFTFINGITATTFTSGKTFCHGFGTSYPTVLELIRILLPSEMTGPNSTRGFPNNGGRSVAFYQATFHSVISKLDEDDPVVIDLTNDEETVDLTGDDVDVIDLTNEDNVVILTM